MPAGLGGGGYLAFTFETTYGSFLPASTAGTVFIPIISENLHYVEDAYYSPQIRQQTVESSREQGAYHVEGDVVMEADANFLPYLLYCARHSITKGGSAPYTYDFTPSQAGSATTAASGATQRSASISVIRNGVVFGYAGCTVNTIQITIDGGILKCTFGIMGTSEQTGAAGTPSWSAPSLFGDAAHSIYVDAAGLTPAFASPDLTFNGFTCDINYNAAAQNRINATRAAAYISYGATEATYTTELDFMSRTEYDNMKNNTRRAIKLESLKGGATYALSTEAVQVTFFNSAYDTYEVGLGGIGDLIMAAVTGRALAIAGGSPFKISVKGAPNIT